ncbi:4-hydroxyacetophenone monooxygenase [Rhodoligotrophos appendicifer]|uniref:flavin-containing monooxygenase n=1 Tax=Rhodoligotrophos appendicifer TaxID=987056 RepID=UPI0011860149|nr:NAD(P)/FAD-dependent oxidoreductase [Rhodoligotrophos appendicifer]
MSDAHELNCETLDSALAEADIRVLLMVLFHMTGDARWLEPPYHPKRDVRLIPDPQAGLGPDIQEEVRAAARKIFADGIPEPVIRDPGEDLMHTMMSICLGEKVAPEYAALNREEMGLVSRDIDWSEQPATSTLANRHALIVGAGVCGLALAIKLGRLGIPYTIVEKNADLGGTWHVNRYPGCGVDTPNHSYSFSFAQGHRWSRYFSPREEIEAYLHGLADRFDLRRNIRFNCRLTAARWDESCNLWKSTLVSGDEQTTFESTFLVSAVGQLNDPSPAPIKGTDSFSGELLHSTYWNEGVAVAGKRVAVIGTGATAMQLVPTIADSCESVDVYQRTPQWARPIAGYSDPISEGIQLLLKTIPFYSEWFRFNMFWRYGDGLLPLLRKDPNWAHPDRAVNRINDRHREEMTDFIRAELGDRPDLIAKCVPSYPPYGKRILLDNGWYRTLLKENVDLIDTAIEQIEATGIRTTDGTLRPADVIVLSTGFKVTEMAARLNITGAGGKTLREVWSPDNPTAYLGLTVPGFPNFFCMLGPNSGPGHGGSVIFQAECQIRHVTGCMVAMIERGAVSIEIGSEAHDDYVRRVDEEHEQLIWSHPGMTTYYRNSRGRVFSVMPWRFVDYWAMTHDVDMQAYQLHFSSTAPQDKPQRAAALSL